MIIWSVGWFVGCVLYGTSGRLLYILIMNQNGIET
jgi:hypothetical protein